MSLVGPRPERPEFVTELEKTLPALRRTARGLPGLTGLAQVNLPPDVDHGSVRRKLVYDLHYVAHLGPGLDLRILAATGLFLLGVPFAASTRFLGLNPDELAEEAGCPVRAYEHGRRDAEPEVELVSQAVPAWRES